jgi:hypothetical protein
VWGLWRGRFLKLVFLRLWTCRSGSFRVPL